MASQSEQPQAGPSRCDYSPGWLDRTFNSRRKVETLLGPELDKNLSRKDYELLLRSLPGPHYTDFVGITTGIAAMLLPRKKPASIASALVVCAVGSVVGQAARMYTHLQVFKSIENRHGFARAMESVKRKVGYTPGLITFSGKLPAEEPEQPFAQMEPDAPFETASETAPPPKPSAPGKSRWDEIRTDRRVDGSRKAWDNIRQGRRADGTSLQKLPDPQSESQSSFRDEDQVAAQAAFDALVDRERNMRT
ncbi:hypothetical protein C8F01DRAFT_1107901 [Mycena amicta]|nr:hypothetical protein C8F01DRAFT_1107901 [Mycena amicta]